MIAQMDPNLSKTTSLTYLSDPTANRDWADTRFPFIPAPLDTDVGFTL